MPQRDALPIDDALPGIVRALSSSGCVIVQAPPGAGKTTRVAPALWEAGLAGDGQIVLVEPRRLAARAAARRMARERGCQVGDAIGYQVRFDRRAGPRTRILAVTPGILLRFLQDDPFLTAASIVMIDEFHERGADADLCLGMLKLVRETARPELKLVLMSATLDADQAARYLGGCPTVAASGRMHAVRVDYRPRPANHDWPEWAAQTALDALAQTEGGLLVFLPGMREIRQTQRILQEAAIGPASIMPLHGDLPLEQQDAAIAPSPRRKVVLATNVAESSITVEGVSTVIDTGLARTLIYDAGVGLDRLETGVISQASADQRAGRAGRTGPGVCIRLWSEAWHRNLPAKTPAEILRVDLAGLLLHLLALGESQVERFPWLDAPPAENVARAMALLERLGALSRGAGALGITNLGRVLARLPVHPRLGRLLVEGRRLGCLERAAWAAAILSERDVLARPAEARGPRRPSRQSTSVQSDLLVRVERLEAFTRKAGAGPGSDAEDASEVHARAGDSTRGGDCDAPIDPGLARHVGLAQRQLVHVARREAESLETPAGRAATRVGSREPSAANQDEALLRALLAAFPDRVARRRAPGDRRGVLLSGRGVVLAASSNVTEGELFLAVDVDAGAGDALVRIASAIERDWLADRITASTRAYFDGEQEKVVARKQVLLEGLVLEESLAALPESREVEEILLAAACVDVGRVLPESGTEAHRCVTRLRCLAAWMPELALPRLDAGDIKEILGWLAPGCRSFAELRRADWVGALRGKLSAAQWQALDREAPDRLTVPSGSRIALAYEEGRPPVLAVRIQELFGLTETPRIAGGRVRVLLHLLAPNHRPQQVTDDLASFWSNTYPSVRKELRARYPRHPWPDNPLEAPAVRK